MRERFKLGFNMIFSWLWIIRKLVLIVLFLMTDIIFNYDCQEIKSYNDINVILCTEFHFQSKENSTQIHESRNSEFNFLNNYFQSVLNQSKAFEDIIYSDILNNLRSFIKMENNQSVEANKKEHKTHDVRERSENRNNRNKTENKMSERNPSNQYKTNMFLSDINDIMQNVLKNISLGEPRGHENEYLLGYSGSPFGGRQPITGFVEIPENDLLRRKVVDPRKKRSVLHLYNMVLCTTGCNPFAYKGYGCYCGFLGSGYVVDGIDSCCKMHDWCYNSAGCPMFLEYFIPYLWKCYHHQPLCAIDHGYYGGPSSCAQRLCECDRQLALCLRRYPCPSTKAFCTSSPWRLLQNILML